MTRTADDIRTDTRTDTRATGRGFETGPEGFSDPMQDPMHHPPKSADIGLGAGNQPSTAGSARSLGGDGRSFASDQRGITELIKDLRDEATTLFRQEVNLAKTEMTEKGRFFAKQGGKLGAGLGVLAVGGLMLLSALAYGVAAIFDAFLEISTATAFTIGFAIVGTIVAIVGYALYSSARSKINKEPMEPERTLQSLKEDKQWLTNQPHTHPHQTAPRDPATR